MKLNKWNIVSKLSSLTDTAFPEILPTPPFDGTIKLLRVFKCTLSLLGIFKSFWFSFFEPMEKLPLTSEYQTWKNQWNEVFI